MFLRSMARDLFSGDKLRWFAAETLIVVLGILIALSLDDYMSARRDRALAMDYVQRLHCTVTNDLDYARTVWRKGLERKRDALTATLPVIRGDVPVPDNVEAFLMQVGLGGIFGTGHGFFINDAVYEDLLATGNMRLIDDSLRGALSYYFIFTRGQFRRIAGRNTNYVAYVLGTTPAELRDELTIDDITEFGTDFALQRFISDEFRVLSTQEYNRLIFMETLDFEGLAEFLVVELERYRSENAGAAEWLCED